MTRTASILVKGRAGHIGSHAVRALRQQGAAHPYGYRKATA